MPDTAIQQLSLQQLVDRYTEYLVEEAEKTVSDERMANMRRDVKNNQFSNLLSVALATPSPAAVTNWVSYQMGRRDMRRAWKQTGLGDDVIQRIKKIREQAQKAAKELHGDGVSKQHIDELHMLMIRQYIGFMRRWFIAKGGQ